MDIEILNEIADMALSSALEDKDGMINSTVLQRVANCRDAEINKMPEILKPFGMFAKGLGDHTWNTLTLNAAGLEFAKSGGIKAFNERKRRKDLKGERDKWLDRFFNAI